MCAASETVYLTFHSNIIRKNSPACTNVLSFNFKGASFVFIAMKNIALRSFLLIFGCLLEHFNADTVENEDQATIIRDYIRVEQTLLNYFRDAVAFHEAKLNYIKFMRQYFVGDNVLKLDPYVYASDPIQQFKLHKRFIYEWKTIYDAVLDDPIEELNEEYRRRLADFKFPGLEEFRSAVYAYLEYQQTQNIPTKDLAHGDFLGSEFKTPLNSNDCYAIASFCIYNPKKQLLALEWLREAYARLDITADSNYKRRLVVDLAYVLTKTGHVREAFELTGKWVKHTNSDDFHFADMHLYFKALFENRAIHDVVEGTPLNQTTLDWPVYVPSRNTYMSKVCSREYSLDPSYLSKLKCRYSTKGHSLFVLSPLKEEELYLEPKVSIYRQFLSHSDVDRIINFSKGHMTESGIRVSPAQKGHNFTYRLSKSYFIMNGLPEFEYMLKRTDALTGLSNGSAEELQVTYYDAGGFYLPHYDAFPHNYELYRGNRLATVLFYLNDKLKGGETGFINLNVLVEPEVGSALVWDNLKRNGDINTLSAHTACPVIYGHKWIVTRWFHSRGQMFHRPCALNRNE